MGRHNRSSLPPGEEDRLETLNEKILAALREGPKTNKFLSRIALDYGRRIRDLRKQNHIIQRERMVDGLNFYTLLMQPEPEWRVDVEVQLADGRIFIQTISIRADNVGTARNRAQHKATKVKILEARRLYPLPPQPSPQLPRPSGEPFSSFR
jgi:hypothetical protein